MQGAGNDYIYIDCRAAGLPPDAAAWAVQLSRRQFFGGCRRGDLPLCPRCRADGDAAMRMFNADGSEGGHVRQRCALRGWEIFYTLTACGGTVSVSTRPLSGSGCCSPGPGDWAVAGRDGPLYGSTGRRRGAVGLGGGPLLDVPLCAGGRAWRVHCVAVGNPHCVLFTHEPPPTGAELAAWGRALGHHPAFPDGINVEFAQAHQAPPGLAVTVWERGSGATLACGTGACAVAAAAVLTGRCPRGAPILVQLPGGTLEVCVQRDDTVLLTGDAAATFSGTVLIQPCKAPRGVV